MSALKTIVHAESRSRCWSVRNTSATPASPVCVATKMVSTYLDLGAASYAHVSIQNPVSQRYKTQAYLELGGPLNRLLKSRHAFSCRAPPVLSGEVD